MILTFLQKLPNNVSDLGKIIVTTGFDCLPKKQSGHTGLGLKCTKFKKDLTAIFCQVSRQERLLQFVGHGSDLWQPLQQ